MHCVIVTGGLLLPQDSYRTLLEQSNYTIAADSGADLLKTMGIHPDILLGDFDSITPETIEYFRKLDIPLLTHSKEKDDTDTQLAIDHAIEKGATRITIIGGIMGNRLDHILSNVLLLSDYTIPISFVQENQTAWVANGPTTQKISGKKMIYFL